MFNNWIWSDNVDGQQKWENLGTYDVSIPSSLMLRENTFAIETEDGEMLDIEGDDHVIMHRTREVTFERNKETEDLRAYYENNVLQEKQFFEDDEVEYLWNEIQTEKH